MMEEEDMDDDAKSIDSNASYELVESANCGARLQGLLIRLLLSLLVIGACTGALIWSFEKGEAGANNGTIHKRDASVNFTIFVDEYTTAEGTYSVTYRLPDAKNNKLKAPEVYPSFWIQDDTGKRLVHRRDNSTTVYLFPTHAFWVRFNKKGIIRRCDFDKRTNYTTYINRIGLANLTREHSAYESTKNHEKVYVYNGDPSDVIIEGTPQDAFLVTAYADSTNGALLGWDTYFTASNSSKVYLISYWYDQMLPAKPNNDAFDPPSECEPS